MQFVQKEGSIVADPQVGKETATSFHPCESTPHYFPDRKLQHNHIKNNHINTIHELASQTISSQSYRSQLQEFEEEYNQFIGCLLEDLQSSSLKNKSLSKEFVSIITDLEAQIRSECKDRMYVYGKCEEVQNQRSRQRADYQNSITHYSQQNNYLKTQLMQIQQQNKFFSKKLESMHSLQKKLKKEENKIASYQQQSTEHQSLEKEYRGLRQLVDEYELLLESNQKNHSAELVQLRQRLSAIQGQNNQLQKQKLSLQSIIADKTSLHKLSQQTWKSKYGSLQLKTKESLSSLKDSYDSKMAALKKAYIKNTKTMKQSITKIRKQFEKEMLLYWKLTKRDILSMRDVWVANISQ